mgnify:CR=1 FL=1
MLSISVHILIFAGCILLSAIGLAYLNNAAPKLSRSASKELEKDEYLRGEEYIRDMANLNSIRDVKLDNTLRHKIHGS